MNTPLYNGKSKVWNLIFFIIIILSLLLLLYSFIEPYWIKTQRLQLVDADIPDEFAGTKIVFIADIHHGPFFNLTRVNRIVTMINSMAPDIVLLGGDYVHRSKKYIEPVFSELKKIDAHLFYGAVLGNHDHWESSDETKKAMQNADIRLLDNKAYWIEKGNSRIKIGGIGDLWKDKQDLTPLLDEIDESDFAILVSHNPDFFTKIDNSNIDLVLAGHSHGGQVTLLGQWAPILPIKNRQYWKGLHKNKYSSIYVTTGIGTITPPVRFFSRPEIVEITLKRK